MNKEAIKVLNFLASMPSGSDVVSKESLHDLLMGTGGTMMARGRLYNIIGKNIGAGVYRVHLKLTNP